MAPQLYSWLSLLWWADKAGSGCYCHGNEILGSYLYYKSYYSHLSTSNSLLDVVLNILWLVFGIYISRTEYWICGICT